MIPSLINQKILEEMMAFKEISGKKNSNTPYSLLNLALKKEVNLMREVLANFHQEELCLLEADLTRWSEIMLERSDFVVQLQTLRAKRMDFTSDLVRWVVMEGKSELLPSDEESSCEILNQLDQVVALLERINLQNCRNEALFQQVQQRKELPLHCSYPHPLHSPKRKSSVKTYTQTK